jgi:hypothetical protein
MTYALSLSYRVQGASLHPLTLHNVYVRLSSRSKETATFFFVAA